MLISTYLKIYTQLTGRINYYMDSRLTIYCFL